MTKGGVGWMVVLGLALLTGLAFYVLSRPEKDIPGRATPAPTTDGGSTPDSSSSLPVLSRCPGFELIDQTGESFLMEQLLGKAWVAAFLDTDAPGEASVWLTELQQQVVQRGLLPDVGFVAICNDPQQDAADVLGSFDESGRKQPIPWTLLTGPPEQVAQLREALTRGGSSPPLASALVLVDPQGDIRRVYNRRSPTDLDSLLRDLQTTIEERVIVLNNGIVPRTEAIMVLNPPWLNRRRQVQLAQSDKLLVPHDFSFTDRLRSSGIEFRHRIVDDAGRSFVTAHYDHGNGIAVADVDGDDLLDIYFLTQVGDNQLWRNLGGCRFENITESAGVAIADRISVSASFADIDNDGDADLFVTTVRGGNVMLQNDGKGVFRDISESSGLGYVGHSSSAEFFDFDRDGLLDLFLVNVGVYTTDRVVTVAKDRFTMDDPREYTYYKSNADAFAAHLKPARAERSVLYRNLGENRFADVSEQVKLVDLNWTGDASPLDANQDGWPDLYLVNMQGHDAYYENVEGKYFVDKSRELFPATPWGTMGIKVFDVDNDQRLDILLTDMHTDMNKELGPSQEKQKIPKEALDPTLLATDGNHVLGNALFLRQADSSFVEASEQYGVENYWPWGVSVGDVNADGFDDVFITACMNFPYRYAVNSLLLNNRGQEFIDSEFILGVEPRRGGQTAMPWFEVDLVGKDSEHPIARVLQTRGTSIQRVVVWGSLGSRSSVIFDLEGDGDLDIVTNDLNSPPQVLISDLAEKSPLRYLQVELIGTQSNRDGLGAAVRVQTAAGSVVKVHDGQSGYLSQSRLPLYFGLGEQSAVEQVEVTWPSGQTQVVPGPIEANTLLRIRESS